MCYEKSRHASFIHPNANAVASNPWLGYLKYGITDPIPITDADLVIWKPFDGEVFAKLPKSKILAT
jgi:hypothetical protein